MKAQRLLYPSIIENNPLLLQNISIPEPEPGYALIKVHYCGVCHTDLHIAEGEIQPAFLPITLGHQIVGRLVSFNHSGTIAKNNNSIPLHTGQLVGIPWLHSNCGLCDACKRNESNLCKYAIFTGFTVNGGFAEYVTANINFLIPLPDTLDLEQAAPLLCAGIVGYRSLKKADILPGDKVALYGFGASAHICIQLLKYSGCDVFVFTRNQQHQEFAKSLGASWVGNPNEKPGIQLDKSVIFAPSGDIVITALQNIRPGGTVAINAIHMSDIPAFPYSLLNGERTVRSVSNATYQDGLEFLELAIKAKIKSYVQIYSLEEANKALQNLKHSRFNGEAVLKVC